MPIKTISANSHGHYSLASNAYRLALAMRFFVGKPISTGYFEEPRPEFPITNPFAAQNMALFRKEAEGFKEGEEIPMERFYATRLGYEPNRESPNTLQEAYGNYAAYIAEKCKQVLADN